MLRYGGNQAGDLTVESRGRARDQSPTLPFKCTLPMTEDLPMGPASIAFDQHQVGDQGLIHGLLGEI